MIDPEIDALVTRLGLTPDEIDLLVGVFRRASLRVSAESASAPTLILPDGDRPPGEAGPSLPVASDGRYADRGRIATGGMGEVRRVLDQVLEREAAIKILKPALASEPHLIAQFVREARVTAQLQHPNVVAVHELGRLPDGQLFFTMQEVIGDTFTDVIRDLHALSRRGRWGTTESGWTFRRVIDVFHKVCLTVAFAHDRSVVHGDLKPDNVMVGAYGEVRVMDWGLASVVEPGGTGSANGGVAGTPAYMAPEQAFAEPRTQLSDVYALGATLYEVLTGQAPFTEPNPHDVLRRLRRGDRPVPPARIEEGLLFAETRGFHDPPESDALAVPRALANIVKRAMARDPEERHPSAQALADDVSSWLEGTRRTEEARALVAQATEQIPEIEALRVRVDELRHLARTHLAGIARSAPDLLKRPAWVQEDEAALLEREADLREADVEGLLRGVSSVMPGLPEIHVALAERLRAQHAAREAANDHRAAGRIEVHLRAHVTVLPRAHPGRNELAAYLKGDGEVTLATLPQGAEVEVLRYLPVDRRLIASPTTALGVTPLARVKLAMGSYLLRIRAPDRPPVSYPVQIERNGRWTGGPPHETEPAPILLPPDLGPDACYVPAGWARLGGTDGALRPVWVDGFVADRYPVTNAAYIRFLDALVADGREDEALRHVPRERTGTSESQPVYGRSPSGGFVLIADEDGDRWEPDWPVVLVDHADARAYAAWWAARTDLPWRLPSEWEWEKGARGVDGRAFPWGDHEEDTWACTLHAHPGRPLLTPVSSFPEDESPYGLRHCAGNVHEWVLEARDEPLPAAGTRARLPAERDAVFRIIRGGGWHMAVRHARCELRHATQALSRLPYLGFRLVRSLLPSDG